MARDRASDPQNWTAFFSFTIILQSLRLTTYKADGIDGVSVCFLKTVSSHENLRSNDSRRLYDAYVLLDVRRTADASHLSEGFRAKEQAVDPTRQVNMSVFLRGSLHCELARWSAKIQKQPCWEHVQQLISSYIGLLVRKLSCNLILG